MPGKFVTMEKDGQYIDVDISNVKAHEDLGWKVSADGKEDVQAAKKANAKTAEVEAARVEAARVEAARVETERVEAEKVEAKKERPAKK